MALAASSWDGNQNQTWSQVLAPGPGSLEAWERALLGFMFVFRLRERQAMGQRIFHVFPCCFLCFSISFCSTQGDACAPSSENLTTSDLFSVESEKNLRDHLQGFKLYSHVVLKKQLCLSLTYKGLRVPLTEYNLHVVQLGKLRPKQVGM